MNREKNETVGGRAVWEGVMCHQHSLPHHQKMFMFSITLSSKRTTHGIVLQNAAVLSLTMVNYSEMMEKASTVVVHDYIPLEDCDDEDNADPEGFVLSSEPWPIGPTQAMFNTPRPPTSAEHALELYASGLADCGGPESHSQAHVWCAQAARLLSHDLHLALEYCIQSINLKKSSEGYYVLAHILLLQGYTKQAHLAATTAYEIDAWRVKVQHAMRLTTTALIDPAAILGPAFLRIAPIALAEDDEEHCPAAHVQQWWCAQCDPPAPTIMSTPPTILYPCKNKCGTASYCSEACQAKSWKHHQPYCEHKGQVNEFLNGKDGTSSNTIYTTSSYTRVMDGWELPSLDDVTNVFGPSRDIRRMWFNPPTSACVLQPREYQRRATTANASAEGYTRMQNYSLEHEMQHPSGVTAYRNVQIRLHVPNDDNDEQHDNNKKDDDTADDDAGHDLDSYRAARAAFCNVKHSVWDAYCDELLKKQVYVFLTQDYVDALTAYLQRRLAVLPHGGESIVEIGAGNGRLAHHLQQRGIPIVATDDFSWKLDSSQQEHRQDDEDCDSENNNKKKRSVQVRNLSCDQALSTYSPSIVLCAWMPMYLDLTTAFCASPSVQEYILIGPAPLCGHAFDTWGFLGHDDDDSDGEEERTQQPAYVRNGFTRTSLVQLEKLQLCKTDKPTEMFAAQTVSFRRKVD
jgi:MYND finger